VRPRSQIDARRLRPKPHPHVPSRRGRRQAVVGRGASPPPRSPKRPAAAWGASRPASRRPGGP